MSETTNADDLTNMTFEQALEQLEKTVREVEDGELPLHETTALFERGVRLANRCTELLAKADLKITKIQTDYGEGGESESGMRADGDQ